MPYCYTCKRNINTIDVAQHHCFLVFLCWDSKKSEEKDAEVIYARNGAEAAFNFAGLQRSRDATICEYQCVSVKDESNTISQYECWDVESSEEVEKLSKGVVV